MNADEKLLQNVLDEINRLNNELKDLETYKDEFTPEEIEETKKKTLEQLSETQKMLEKMKKGNMSLMTKYEESQKKLRQVIAENYHVNDLINSYLANETEFLREKLQSTIRLHALKKISEQEFNSQVVQILEMISKNNKLNDEEQKVIVDMLQIENIIDEEYPLKDKIKDFKKIVKEKKKRSGNYEGVESDTDKGFEDEEDYVEREEQD